MAGGIGSIIGGIAGGILTGGAGPAIGAGIGAAIPSLSEVAKVLVDRLVPDPAKRDEAQAAIEAALSQREAVIVAAVQQQNSEQNAINLAATQSQSFWQSGARPAALWCFVIGFAYNFLAAPILTWIVALIGNALAISFPVPPVLDNSTLMTGLFGLLGMSGLRTYERVQGVETPSPAAHNPSIPRR